MAREDGFFDDMARGLADGSITRGKAIRLMGAAVVGGALGSLGIGEASADPPGCKRNGKNCKRNGQCCSGVCQGTCQEPPLGSCIPPDAIACDLSKPLSCPGGIEGKCSCIPAIGGGAYCGTQPADTTCSTSCDCPEGQFCRPNGPTGACTIAGTVCTYG